MRGMQKYCADCKDLPKASEMDISAHQDFSFGGHRELRHTEEWKEKMEEVNAIVLHHSRNVVSLKVRLYLFVANRQCCNRDHGSSHTIAEYNLSDGLKDLKSCFRG
jgi:hypothetical protein